MAKYQRKRSPSGTKNNKKFEPTSANIKEIERLAAIGLSMEDCGWVLGYGGRATSDMFKNNDAAREAYKRGSAQGIESIGAALFANAMKGNVVAQIFFMKVRAKWRENVRVDNTDQGKVVINIKPPKSAEPPPEKKGVRIKCSKKNKSKT